jgi:hypothetical protein
MQGMGDYLMAFLFLELWWTNLGYLHFGYACISSRLSCSTVFIPLYFLFHIRHNWDYVATKIQFYPKTKLYRFVIEPTFLRKLSHAKPFIFLGRDRIFTLRSRCLHFDYIWLHILLIGFCQPLRTVYDFR